MPDSATDPTALYGDRVDVVAGDMFADPLPPDHDMHLFSHVLHDWGEPQVRQLLAASFAALTPGGWLVDHDAHVDEAKTGSPARGRVFRAAHALDAGEVLVARRTRRDAPRRGVRGVAWRSTAGDRSAILARKPG